MKKNEEQGNCNEMRTIDAEINYWISYIVAESYNNFVDLFFLYLLYKFNKRCLKEKISMSSALIAHDSCRVALNFSSKVEEKCNEEKNTKLHSQNREYLSYIIA